MINVALYMATSVNGLINDASGNTPWSEAEWLRYGKILQKAGCLIVGRRPHDIMAASHEYEQLSVRRIIVLTNGTIETQSGITSCKTPRQALDQLEDEGFKEVIVGGGAATNSAFLKMGLVQEIYLDIEPFLFGNGLPPLASLSDFSLKLQLLEIDRYAPNALGLKYEIVS